MCCHFFYIISSLGKSLLLLVTSASAAIIYARHLLSQIVGEWEVFLQVVSRSQNQTLDFIGKVCPLQIQKSSNGEGQKRKFITRHGQPQEEER
jgi:hypothetical protein